MKLLLNFLKLTVMELTNFEKDYLRINNIPYVIRLFHTLLKKVEREPHRQWTHNSLRNYVDATYALCSSLTSRDSVKSWQSVNQRNPEKTDKTKINFYSDDDLLIFFTGLYTSGTYHGLKNGLYFVGNPSKGFSVKTRKDIFETTEFDGKKALMQINHRDSFENELVSHEGLYIKNIKLPNIMSPEFASNIIKPLKQKLENIDNILKDNKDGKSFQEILQKYEANIKNILETKKPIKLVPESESKIINKLKEIKEIKDKITVNSWLHILRDGIDNLPTDFVKSFFNKSYEVPSPVERYKKRKDWIEKCIEKSCSNNEVNSFKYYQEIMLETMQPMVDESKIHNLPVMFYKKIATYNYLLPMYLMNSGKPDFCIVLKHKIEDGKYTGIWEPVTSLNMDEVYCDIRVFGKDAVERVRDWW